MVILNIYGMSFYFVEASNPIQSQKDSLSKLTFDKQSIEGSAEEFNKSFLFLYSKAGAGHIQTCRSLSSVMKKYPVVERSLMDELFSTIDIKKKYLGIDGESIYNHFILKKGYTFLIKPCLTFIHYEKKLLHKKGVDAVRFYMKEKKPKMVLSFSGFTNKILGDAMELYDPRVPFVVVMSDFSEVYEDYWMQAPKAYYICGTEKARNQLMKKGVAKEKIFKTSGMIIHPQFYKTYKPLSLENIAPRSKKIVGFISFGGYAADIAENILEELSYENIQWIVACGHNQNLFKRLKKKNKYTVLSFVDNLAPYLQMADFFIGKPGPGSCTEAIISHLPCFVYAPSSCLLQEKEVKEWIIQNKFGTSFDSIQSTRERFSYFMKNFKEYKKNVKKYKNNAVFEAKAFLCSLIS
jgi:UDP-N-acetylglucosamine:LPS N-acetylglucosamine transferase